MSSYDAFARYYDLDYGEVGDDIFFYRELLRAAGGPALEVGCGTGRLLVALAGEGLPLTGIDVSKVMLAAARAKLAGLANVRLRLADVASLALEDRFALAFLSADTFLLLADRGRQQEALARLHAHLQPEGLVSIDVFNPFADGHLEADGALVLDWVRTEPETGATVSKLVARKSDLAEQMQAVTFIYDAEREGEVRRTLASFDLRFVFRDEMHLMLERAGFRCEQVYGGYDLDPYTTDSERMIFVARKEA